MNPNKNLYELATRILLLEEIPLSKVRFAKTIYFVHKALIQKNILTDDYIQYYRMPLGPVPFGFMTLDSDYSDIITEKIPTGLSYNSILYSTISKRKEIDTLNISIKNILNDLKNVSTSELIDSSHLDKSWVDNLNGTLYTMSKEDYDNKLPFNKSPSAAVNEDQSIQANLVRGMVKDIVDESTDLEYPSNE